MLPCAEDDAEGVAQALDAEREGEALAERDKAPTLVTERESDTLRDGVRDAEEEALKSTDGRREGQMARIRTLSVSVT